MGFASLAWKELRGMYLIEGPAARRALLNVTTYSIRWPLGFKVTVLIKQSYPFGKKDNQAGNDQSIDRRFRERY